MYQSFLNAKAEERLDAHIEYLNGKTKYFVQDASSGNRKLHDLQCIFDGTWFECKADRSRFTNRLLLEYKANVPLDLLQGIPEKTVLPYADYAEYFSNLPSKYNALLTDTDNLEPMHLLSYRFLQSNQFFVGDIRQVRAVADAGDYPFMIVGGCGVETWRTVARLVPLADVEAVKLI